ncbi:MAG: peptide ABC transporter substrate-binding protein, partial [Streptosporangiaceae bacterium]
MRVRARLLAAAASLMALVLAAGGCAFGGGSAGDSDSFSIYIAEPNTLLPGDSNETNSAKVLDALFTGLVEYAPKTGEAQFAVAKSITSKDQRTWTIRLKKGWTFHNGEPVTAQSFARAWSAAAYGPNGWHNNAFFANIKGYDALNPSDPDGDGPKEAPKPSTDKLSGLDVVGDRTLEVTLKEPFSQFPMTLGYNAFYPLPKAAFKEGFDKFDDEPIGDGPYKMAGGWRHDEAIRLTRYNRYGGAHKAYIRDLTFKIYDNINTAYNDLLAGNLDIMPLLPTQRIKDAQQTFDDHYIQRPSSVFQFIGFPMFDDAMKNRKLRYAISMAINRKKIIKAVFYGTYRPARSLVSPAVPGSRPDPCGQHCRFDPKKAKQLFKEAGGYDGTLYLWYNSDGPYEAWMEAIANQLKKNLGVDVRFKISPSLSDLVDTLYKHKANGP